MTITSPSLPTSITVDGPTARTGIDLGALPGALRSEWIKLSSLRTNRVMLGLSAVIGGAIAAALAASSTDPTLTASELFIYPLPLVATMAIVTGILMFTGEAQHGTLALALTARPARW